MNKYNKVRLCTIKLISTLWLFTESMAFTKSFPTSGVPVDTQKKPVSIQQNNEGPT